MFKSFRKSKKDIPLVQPTTAFSLVAPVGYKDAINKTLSDGFPSKLSKVEEGTQGVISIEGEMNYDDYLYLAEHIYGSMPEAVLRKD